MIRYPTAGSAADVIETDHSRVAGGVLQEHRLSFDRCAAIGSYALLDEEILSQRGRYPIVGVTPRHVDDLDVAVHDRSSIEETMLDEIGNDRSTERSPSVTTRPALDGSRRQPSKMSSAHRLIEPHAMPANHTPCRANRTPCPGIRRPCQAIRIRCPMGHKLAFPPDQLAPATSHPNFPERSRPPGNLPGLALSRAQRG